MSAVFMLACGLFSVVVGFLIGSVGIGGVLLVPGLVFVGGVDIGQAVAAAMFGYMFTGVIGTGMYARQGSLEWRASIWLCVGAVPTAYAGTLAIRLVPDYIMELLIAMLVVFAGWQALKPTRQENGDNVGEWRRARSGASLAIGGGTGFLSALTGTGGPVVLLPLLLWLEVPVLSAVGLAQVIQLPIASLATLGNTLQGRLDLVLGFVLGSGFIVGTLLGAHVAHRITGPTLKRVLAFALIGVGVLIVVRLASGFVVGWTSPGAA